jgi:crossover junction endodeoxyribonuclease RusA
MVESSAKVKPWRQDVKYAALETLGAGPPIQGPVDIHVTFYLARPKGHYGTGRNSGRLRDNAPKVPAGKPDLDKLLRSTCDALDEANVFMDDAQIVAVVMRKQFADGRPPGADIQVIAWESQPAFEVAAS